VLVVVGILFRGILGVVAVLFVFKLICGLFVWGYFVGISGYFNWCML